MSVMFSVHRGLGQSGAPGIGVTGASVRVVIVTLPFGGWSTDSVIPEAQVGRLSRGWSIHLWTDVERWSGRIPACQTGPDAERRRGCAGCRGR
jgi:hypothetical protein